MPRIFTGKVIFFLLILHTLDICLAPVLGSNRPIFSYLWILFVAFYWPLNELIPAVLWVGVLRDLSGSQPLGIETVSLVLVTSALSFVLLKFEREFFLMRLAAGFLFVFFSLFLNLMLSHFLALGFHFTWMGVWSCLVSAFFTALIITIFLTLARGWFLEEAKLRKQYELFG